MKKNMQADFFRKKAYICGINIVIEQNGKLPKLAY